MKKELEWLKEEVADMGEGAAVWKSDVEHLINQIEQPVLPEIPDYVAEYIHDLKNRKYSLNIVLSTIYKSERREDVSNEFQWAKENTETFVKAWLDGYTVEEKKYKVVVKDEWGGMFYLTKHSDELKLEVSERLFDTQSKDFQLTEQEIKDYDERYFAFAVEVTE